ncbi:MAG: PAS domain-containing protein [Clostridiales bacterium]|nr:PAS domain-containing protein [Clostridiales bacterium]
MLRKTVIDGKKDDRSSEIITPEQLKTLIDSIQGGIATYTFSPEGLKIIYFNEGLCRMLGYTREEYERATKDSVITAVFDEDVPYLQEQIDRHIEDGSPINCTYRVHVANSDEYKWLSIRVTPEEKQGSTRYSNAIINDVTEQKLAEESALIHEAEMGLVMLQMGRILCEYDVQSGILTMPDEYAAKYGVATSLCNIPYIVKNADIIDEAYVDTYIEFYEAIREGKPTGKTEYREKWVDGSTHWKRAEFSSVFDSGGKPVKAIIAVEDTTQQHLQYELEQSRPTLSEKNLLVHALFNLNTGETLDYAYRDGTIVPEEERTAFLFGGDNLDFIIIDNEERRRYKQLNDPKKLLKCYQNGETELSLDYRRRMSDGEVIWVRNLLRMVRQPGGDDILLFEYCYDIEAEKIQELMYKSLISENFDYVARVNGENHHFDIITNAGEAYGMSPVPGNDMDEAVRVIVRDYIHPDDREMITEKINVEMLKKDLSDRELLEYTYRMVLPDGEIRYKEINIYYMDRQRELIIITRKDISSFAFKEVQKNQELVNALNEAEQANRAKGEFLSRMSHDMRTPMNAILGMTALAKEEDNPPRTIEYLENINESSKFLLGLINDILDLSKIESGHIELNEFAFSQKDFDRGINTVIRPIMEAKKIDFVYNMDCGATNIVADKLRFNQIFFNLLSNAAKYTPEGGRVEFTAEHIPGRNGKNGMRFIIRDNGIGMSEKFLEIAFSPFTREERNVSSEVQGSGLGLAIVKNLVEAMEGNISVSSTVGQGTEFVVDLYATAGDKTVLDSVKMADYYPALDAAQMLLVEDNEMNVMVAQKLLERKGCIVTVARNGQEGVRLFSRSSEGHYSAVLMDVRMPVMDGFEATRRIRALDRADAAEVPIIAMTADAFIEDRSKMFEAGMNIHLTKPIEPHLMYSAISGAILSK